MPVRKSELNPMTYEKLCFPTSLALFWAIKSSKVNNAPAPMVWWLLYSMNTLASLYTISWIHIHVQQLNQGAWETSWTCVHETPQSRAIPSSRKLDLHSKRMDCLGHIIDNNGIHMDSDKMARIHKWQTPRNKHNMQRFLGLVNYIAHYMPNVSVYMGPLLAIQRNGHPF